MTNQKILSSESCLIPFAGNAHNSLHTNLSNIGSSSEQHSINSNLINIEPRCEKVLNLKYYQTNTEAILMYRSGEFLKTVLTPEWHTKIN